MYRAPRHRVTTRDEAHGKSILFGLGAVKVGREIRDDPANAVAHEINLVHNLAALLERDGDVAFVVLMEASMPSIVGVASVGMEATRTDLELSSMFEAR